MKTYNFNMAFSPLEFQKFARDMLQKRENVFFESYAEGSYSKREERSVL